MKCDKCGQDVPVTPFEQAWEASQHGKVGPITAKTFWDKCADAFASDIGAEVNRLRRIREAVGAVGPIIDARDIDAARQRIKR